MHKRKYTKWTKCQKRKIYKSVKNERLLEHKDINLKDKYIEFIFYYMKKFEDQEAKLGELKYSLLNDIIPGEFGNNINKNNSNQDKDEDNDNNNNDKTNNEISIKEKEDINLDNLNKEKEKSDRNKKRKIGNEKTSKMQIKMNLKEKK